MGPTDGNDMLVRGSLPDVAVGISVPIWIYISMDEKDVNFCARIRPPNFFVTIPLSLGMVDIAFIRYI